MATRNSNLVEKKTRHRAMEAGKPHTVTGHMFFEAGDVLATNDVLRMVPIGENQAILSVSVLAIGDTSTMAGSVGRFQILDSAGDPVIVERRGPSGEAATKYTSPATDGDLYAASAQLDGYAISNQATPAKLAGPADVGILITTGATFGADTDLFVSVTIQGEIPTEGEQVDGGNGDHGYLIA